jgi:superoxide dismutase
LSPALEPKISKTTLTIHHDKHHAKYVTVANQVRLFFPYCIRLQLMIWSQMIEGTEMEKDDCTTIVMKAHKAGNQALFNNAAQVNNH